MSFLCLLRGRDEFLLSRGARDTLVFLELCFPKDLTTQGLDQRGSRATAGSRGGPTGGHLCLLPAVTSLKLAVDGGVRSSRSYLLFLGGKAEAQRAEASCPGHLRMPGDGEGAGNYCPVCTVTFVCYLTSSLHHFE